MMKERLPSSGQSHDLIYVLEKTAPGTSLRDGLDNVLRAQSGALIVLAESEEIKKISSQGFVIDTPYSPSRLYELAKMDGAIILSKDGSRILTANSHLNPDRGIPSSETGTRHRTAEQVAKQTGYLVICISERRSIITLYKGNLRYALQDAGSLLNTANQAIQTLARYRQSLERAFQILSVAEFDHVVSLADVAKVIQRAEMFRRVAEELATVVTELGDESRLIRMQREELLANMDEEVELAIRDYIIPEEDETTLEAVDRVVRELADCSHEALLDQAFLIEMMGYGNGSQGDHKLIVGPHGYRVLSKIPRLPRHIIENIVDYFGSFHDLIYADLHSLDEVEGVGEIRAKQVLRGLERQKAQTMMEGTDQRAYL